MLANSLQVAPDSAFSVQWTADMIFCVIVGGLGTIEGPVIGAIIFFALQQRLDSHGVWYLVLLGVVAIVMTIYARRGIWGLVNARTGLRLFPVGYRVRRAGGEPRAPSPSASQAVTPGGRAES